MKYIKLHPLLILGSLGFVISLGAPIGYYIHSYVFGKNPTTNFIDHIHWVNQNQTHIIAYIALGTTFFFTLFGLVIGKFFNTFFEQEQVLGQMKQSKKAIINHFISQIRTPTTTGIECLLYIKEDLKNSHMEKLINVSINELKRIDQGLTSLINLADVDQIELRGISFDELISYINLSSEHFRLALPLIEQNQPNHFSGVTADPLSLVMALELLFEWLALHEVQVKSIEIASSSYSNSPSMIKVHIELNTQSPQDLIHKGLFKEALTSTKGICLINEKTIEILLLTSNENRGIKSA